jgi:eukaryotic-like serine/threonine-protein kinase
MSDAAPIRSRNGDAPMMPPDDHSAEPVGLPWREPESDRAARMPVEMLASEYLDELRRGEAPGIDEYISRYPEHADELRDLLPLVTAMEEWKADKHLDAPPRRLPETFNIHRLGDCRILREIGRGGMGIVFEGIQESVGRRVAVKLLPWRHGRDESWQQRFQREARLAAGLRHANIVPVFRFGEYEGFCYYVMPFIVGMGLDWVIEQLRTGDGSVYAQQIEQARMGTGVRGEDAAAAEGDDAVGDNEPLSLPAEATEPAGRQLTAGSWKKIAKIGAQAAAALRHAHGRGLLHRDIKPANLLLDTSGTVWITDFGLAQPIEQVAESPSLAGTLRYMSPEQYQGLADERSDIYALGLTLYELITLQPAFAGGRRAELMRRVRAGDFPPVQEVVPRIPRQLAEIITKATATDPQDRFASADALTAALLSYINDRPVRQYAGGLLWRLLSGRRGAAS